MNPTIKIKVFINEDGVSCVMKDTDLQISRALKLPHFSVW